MSICCIGEFTNVRRKQVGLDGFLMRLTNGCMPSCFFWTPGKDRAGARAIGCHTALGMMGARTSTTGRWPRAAVDVPFLGLQYGSRPLLTGSGVFLFGRMRNRDGNAAL